MSKKIFLNLPVKDLKKSIAFFTALGYTFNPDFTDETATCMIVSDTIFVMLLTHEKFMMFSPKPICDTSKYYQALFCVSMETRESVDDIVTKAVAAGATTFEEPQDHGMMYGRSFIDLDGHGWEHMWMDPNFKPHQ